MESHLELYETGLWLLAVDINAWERYEYSVGEVTGDDGEKHERPNIDMRKLLILFGEPNGDEAYHKFSVTYPLLISAHDLKDQEVVELPCDKGFIVDETLHRFSIGGDFCDFCSFERQGKSGDE